MMECNCFGGFGLRRTVISDLCFDKLSKSQLQSDENGLNFEETFSKTNLAHFRNIWSSLTRRIEATQIFSQIAIDKKLENVCYPHVKLNVPQGNTNGLSH